MGKKFNKTFLVLSILCFAMGIRSNWREYNHHQESIVAKANILSVEIKPMSGKAVASINYSISYQRDNTTDTLPFSSTRVYSTNEPLPPVEELKKVDLYVHYIPIDKKDNTAFADRTTISNSRELDYTFRSGMFTIALVLLVFAYMFGKSN